jgi:hypothetical protein
MNPAKWDAARSAFAIACTVFTAVWLWLAVSGSDQLPGHVDASGTVTRWDGKWSLLLILGGVTVGLALMFGFAKRVLSRVPASAINMPSREQHAYWTAPERRGEFDHRMATDLMWLGSATILLMAVMLAVVGGASGDSVDILPLVAPTAMYTVAVIGYTLYLALGPRYRVPAP